MFSKMWRAGFWLVKKLVLALLLSVLFVVVCLWLSRYQFTPSQVFLFVFVYVAIYAGIELRALYLSNKTPDSDDGESSADEPAAESGQSTVSQ